VVDCAASGGTVAGSSRIIVTFDGPSNMTGWSFGARVTDHLGHIPDYYPADAVYGEMLGCGPDPRTSPRVRHLGWNTARSHNNVQTVEATVSYTV
jgi:hypothetical protein